MFVNLGLTADAAAAHRHEFSSRPNQQSTNSFLSRSAASIFPLSIASPSKRSTPPLLALEPPKPVPISLAENPSTPVSAPPSSDQDRRPNESSYAHHDPLPYNSIKKPLPRPRTSFRLAHPPPSVRHKRLRIRPRLLLQLQQISQTARPIPALDVLPSTLFGPRLAGKFPLVFRGKDRLGPNDLIVVPSDSYEPLNSGDDDRSVSSEEYPNDHRQVVATICQLRKEDARIKGMAEICLEGSCWEASPLPNGSYEFVGTTESGVRQTVRWVLRAKSRRRISAPVAGSDAPCDESKRFTFSVIDPTTRRHPVIAWMSRHSIDILDEYSNPSACGHSPYTSPSSPTRNLDPQLLDPYSPDTSEQPPIETDHNLRTLIVVTGIWIAFKEGWSQNHLTSDATSAGSPNLTNFPATQLSRTPSAVGNDIDKSSPVDRRSRRTSLQFVGSRIRQTSSTVLRRSASLTTDSQKQAARSNNSKASDFAGADFIPVANGRRGPMIHGPVNRDGAPPMHSPPRGQELLEPSLKLDDHRENTLSPAGVSNQPRLAAEDLHTSSTHLERGVGITEQSTTSPMDDTRSPLGTKSFRGKEKKWRKLSNWFDSVSKRSKAR